MSEIRLVAFDVFGTIAGGNILPGPYVRLARELNIDRHTFALAAQTLDLSIAQLVDHLAPRAAATQRRALAEQVAAEVALDTARIVLFPEVVEVFEALRTRGIGTALVSNLAPPYAEPVIRLLSDAGVLPELCVWSFEAGCMKPDPAIYQQLFDRSGYSPSQILFVGDRTDRDLWPPRALGCQSRLIARHTDHVPGIDTSDRIADLRELYTGLNLVPSLQAGEIERTQAQRDRLERGR